MLLHPFWQATGLNQMDVQTTVAAVSKPISIPVPQTIAISSYIVPDEGRPVTLEAMQDMMQALLAVHTRREHSSIQTDPTWWANNVVIWVLFVGQTLKETPDVQPQQR